MDKQHLVMIYQKKGPELHDYYPTEHAAKETIKAIADAANPGAGTVVTPSGNVTFEASNFAGAVYKGEW